MGLNDGMHAYGNYALVYKPGALPAGLAIGWVSTWNRALIFPLFPFLFLLFPDGRLPSRRWRPAAWGAGLLGGLVVLLCPFRAGPLEYFPKIQNPTGIHALSQSAFSTLTFIYLIVLLTNHGFLGGPLPPGPRRRTPAAQVGSGGRSRVGSHRDRRGKVAAVVPQLAAVGGDSGDLCRRDRGGDLEVSAL